MKISLVYDKGSILIYGIGQVPFAIFDPRTNQLRAQALHYSNILSYLDQSDLQYEDKVLDLIPTQKMSIDEGTKLSLKTYQKKAISNWINAGKRGCIVLPTGSGKTIIGIKIIEHTNQPTLIIVPTIELMNQWSKTLSRYFPSITIGNLGGGEYDLQSITVSTYDSAYIKSHLFGNKFSLVIFDELHHLGAPGYRTIAEQLSCPYRLGLTATFEREDNYHTKFSKLVGGIVYQSSLKELTKEKHLASFVIERRYVKLLSSEMKEYQKYNSLYRSLLKELGINLGGILGFKKLVFLSGKNKKARDALLARNHALNIALNSKAKINELRKILSNNIGKKTIIFTQHNKLVYNISNEFLIPFITHKSTKQEREDVLDRFKTGKYNTIVTSKVLDEGVDVPDAEIGIIVSGTGSKREYVQRLGRLLRNISNSNKEARLIELISSETQEVNTSIKRKRALKSI
ncbi:MAG: DEAD/DEAH box helicase family protein [Nitrososphaeraceae archaeon]